MRNRLSRIVARTGDNGTTSLSDGSRVDKDTPRMEAIGTIDELKSVIGFAQSQVTSSKAAESVVKALLFVQQDLFDLGGGMSLPGKELLSRAHVVRLDTIMAQLNETLQPPKEFILPVGSPAIGALHMARSVCRRTERRLLSAIEQDPQPVQFALAYLNRLSDLLFVAARVIGRIDGDVER
jgi:cob(I)alamin adenosyltransferase